MRGWWTALDEQVVWLDGELVPTGRGSRVRLRPRVTVGDGVFETLQVLRGTPFAIRRHLGRLRRSAAGLGLKVPMDDQGLRHAMQALVERQRRATGAACA